MNPWKQILHNTITFDALTMYMLNAEFSVYSRQTLNEYITYRRGKTFASRRSNILKTGTWNVRYGETNIFYKNAIRENSGNVVRIDLVETRAAWTEISISIGMLRRLCQEQIYRFNHLFECSELLEVKWKVDGREQAVVQLFELCSYHYYVCMWNWRMYSIVFSKPRLCMTSLIKKS